ncbi:MAG: SRPBCC family protein [Rhodobacterales bacterium]
MKFTSIQDIIAPADFVFQQLADFDFYESYAMRMGAQVERQDHYREPQPGMCWSIKGHFRGKDRALELTLDRYSPSDTLSYICTTKSLNALINLGVIPLSRTETRLQVVIDIQAKSLAARVALQSAKLAKKSLDRKFDTHMRNISNNIGGKYNG